MEIDDILESLEDDDLHSEDKDLKALTRAWVTERSAPEVLPWPTELMDRVLTGIHEQIEQVEEQTGNADPKTNFRLIVTQTELERFKFLVRSLLRIRLAKIDAFPHHHLSVPEASSHLSPSELQYLTNHTALLHQHYHSSFLAQLPNSLQKLDDKAAGGISMVEGPDMDKAVFVRALKGMDDVIEIPGTDTRLSLGRGEVVITRWRAVRDLVLGGQCELI